MRLAQNEINLRLVMIAARDPGARIFSRNAADGAQSLFAAVAPCPPATSDSS